jgi:hypothetical protein
VTEEEMALELLLQQRRQGAFGGAPAEPQGAFGPSQRNPYALLGEAIQNNDPGPPRNIPHDLATMGMSALDPFGLTSGAVGLVSPDTRDLIRAQYEANPESAVAGAFMTPFGKIQRGVEAGVGAIGRGIAAMPKTAGVTAAGGGAALGLSPSSGGAAPSEELKRLQVIMRDKGYYFGKIDGEMGPATLAAKQAYEAEEARKSAAELAKANSQAEGLKAQAEAAKAQAEAETAKANAAKEKRLEEEGKAKIQRDKEGDERIKAIEKDVPFYRQALRDYGPTVGYGLGILGGFATKGIVNKISNVRSSNAAKRADDLAKGITKRDDGPGRVAKVNQYWSEGGAKDVPFTPNAGKSPPYKPNPDAPGADSLYQPKSNTLLDSGIAAGFGAESAMSQFMMQPEAKAELEAARAALKDDKGEAAIRRYQAALDKSAAAEMATNFGRTGGLSYVAGMKLMPRNPSRPDVSKAEAERMRIDEAYANRNKKPAAKEAKKSDAEVVDDLKKATEAPPKLPEKAAKGSMQDLRKNEDFQITAAELVAQLNAAGMNRDIARKASGSFENKRKLTDIEARAVARQLNGDPDFLKKVEKAKKDLAKKRETRDGKAALEALGRTRKETD